MLYRQRPHYVYIVELFTHLIQCITFSTTVFNSYQYITSISKTLIFFTFYLQVKVNVLDKNDSPPQFPDTPLVFTVSEDLGAGHTVATIRATDPDTIGTLSYALMSGDGKKFLLDSNTGILTLRDTLDRETKDTYELIVRVTDGVQFSETSVTIQVC